MKLTKHIYRLSGVEYHTNSNVFAVATSNGLALIDSGTGLFHWEAMLRVLKNWELDQLPISHLFLTHCHTDHSGNAWRVKKLGATLIAGEHDRRKIIEGDPGMGDISQRPDRKLVPCDVDLVGHEGDVFDFGEARITILETPGHTDGCLSFLIDTDGIRAMCSGDMFFVAPRNAQDDVEIALNKFRQGSYNHDKIIATLKRLSETPADILLPGHYFTYFGDTKYVCKMAYQAAAELDFSQED